MGNAQTVQGIYEAFGRGDIPAILERLDDDVRWEHWPHGNEAQRHGVPWLAERRGPGEVAGFFESLGQLEFGEFAPKELLESNGTVVAIIDVDLTVKATGSRIRGEEIHLWRFGADGKVTELRHFIDTAKHVEAAAAGGQPPG